MLRVHYILFFALYSFLFTVAIFILGTLFIPSVFHEESFIEPYKISSFSSEKYSSFSGVTQQEIDAALKSLRERKKQDSKGEEGVNLSFHFIPDTFSQEISDTLISGFKSVLYEEVFFKKIEKLSLLLFRDAAEVRGRMEDGNIYLFHVSTLDSGELYSLLIHEFSHYIDIYSFPRTAFGDTSDIFYSISWNQPTLKKENLSEQDFVSGYAMTNQYEDFAESFTYFVFHNRDFLEKTAQSPILLQKYSFFEKYIFQKKEFYKQSFSSELPKNYYWDITKIPIQYENFLQYLENNI